MKKEDVPQYKDSKLNSFTREVVYVKDENGEYTKELSAGWEVKSNALEGAWDGIKERIEEARQKVKNNEASPVLFYMEVRLMDLPVLAGYTGFWKWKVKRHMKPKVFNKLSEKKLQKYADAFEISVEQLKNIDLYVEK